MKWRALTGCAVVLAALSTSALAQATDCEQSHGLSSCVTANNLWLRPGAGPFLSVGSGTTAAPGSFAFSVLGSYLSRPIALKVASPDPAGTTVHVVDDQVDLSFLWALGVTSRLELTLAAPVSIYRSGAGLSDALGTKDVLPRSSLGDMRFGAAYAILEHPRRGPAGGTSLIARLDFAAPTGDSASFAGSGRMTIVPSLVLDHRVGRWDFAAEAGARVRPAYDLGGSRVGSQIMGSAGVSFDVLPERSLLSVGAEAFALYTLGGTIEAGRFAGQPSAPVFPAEWMATVRSAPILAGDLGFVIGAGGPLPLTSEPSVTNPRFRVSFGVRYAPQGTDRDSDGVLDRDDQCPSEPEDRDGFQDEDGCPDPDNDGDGIADKLDRCRDDAEDFDGFQDEDGCPDLDDDKDGVPDSEDQCRNEPEDRDGFKDEDGCPDLDNDGDNIPDADDKCPNGAEDFDGFRDEDGCPDPDNDLDGTADTDDQCPAEPEDFDGFKDGDGCPDPDNDGDGVLDAQDKCPNERETINDVDDDDGCPEPGARSLVSVTGGAVVLDAPARFAARRAALTPALEKTARMVAILLRSQGPGTTLILEGYADRAGDESGAAVELSAARADAFKAALVQGGVAAASITSVAGDPTQARPTGSQLSLSVQPSARKTSPPNRANPPSAPTPAKPTSP